MTTLSLPFLTAGLGSLLAGVFLTVHDARLGTKRGLAALATVLAVLSFGAAAFQAAKAGGQALLDPLVPWLEADALDSIPCVFFPLLTLLFITLAPKRDTSGPALAGMLLLCFASVMTYSAANLPMLVAGWWLSSVPFAFGFFGNPPARKVTSVFLIASSVALTAAVWLLHATSMDSLSHLNRLTLGLLMLAVALRKGLFPLHSWVVTAFEHGPLIPTALLFNGHLGALLMARTEARVLPEFAHTALAWLGIAALVTALIASIRGFAEKKPRRLLAFVCISQASFILAGLATSTTQGVTGALLHWFVVTAASSGLVAIIRILEVRVMDVADPDRNLGLAVKAPRLATFFLICALALIGLPGTLGYCAEDLLFHGALESHTWMGLSLLVATAFNAINLLRLFGILFLGVLPKHVIDIPDALPRERWPLALCTVFLIAGGILPGQVFPWLAPAASTIPVAAEHTPASH